ncbi:MAG: hypothetical protein ABH867_04460 [Patescibacteria group bacterium]
MKHFIQFDQNGEIQFVIKAEFEAVIPDEQKDRFIEVPAQKALEIKEKLNEYKVADGKVVKKPAATAQPEKQAILPTLDQ